MVGPESGSDSRMKPFFGYNAANVMKKWFRSARLRRILRARRTCQARSGRAQAVHATKV